MVNRSGKLKVLNLKYFTENLHDSVLNDKTDKLRKNHSSCVLQSLQLSCDFKISIISRGKYEIKYKHTNFIIIYHPFIQHMLVTKGKHIFVQLLF